MKPKISFLLLLAFSTTLLLSGCRAFTEKTTRYLKAEESVKESERLLSERSKQLTEATYQTLVSPGSASTNPNVRLAVELSKENVAVQGVPDKPININPLLSDMRSIVSNAEVVSSNTSVPLEVALEEQFLVHKGSKEWEEFKTSLQNNVLLRQEYTKNQQKLQEVALPLLSMGAKAEKEEVKTFWKKTGFWSTTVIIIGGLIALCVFVPAVLPVLGSIVSWIAGKIPSVISTIGVVSTKTFDAVVEGYGNAKAQVKAMKVEAQVSADRSSYSREEVLKLLEDQKSKIYNTYKANLSAATSNSDKAIVALREQEVVDRGLSV